jgi:hypothetical protein
MNHPDIVIEAIRNETTAHTIGHRPDEYVDALYERWHQLIGMEQLALLLGASPEVKTQLRTHAAELLAEYRERVSTQ